MSDYEQAYNAGVADLEKKLKKAVERSVELGVELGDTVGRLQFVSGYMSNDYPELSAELTRLWEGR